MKKKGTICYAFTLFQYKAKHKLAYKKGEKFLL